MSMFYKIFLIIIILCFGIYLIYYVAAVNEEIKNNNFYNYNEWITLNVNTSFKSILYWDTFHGDKTMGIGLGREIFSHCPVNNCFTTNNKQLLPIENFNAIIFHGARYQIKDLLKPAKRAEHQKYIFFSYESAYNAYIDRGTFVNFYNWTMTFRKDSDVRYPYGVFRKKKTKYELPTKEFLKKKVKKIAWFASNCYTEGGKQRKKYVNKLQNLIPIDKYGNCGKLHCPHSNKCYEMLEKNYKFYLSFENSFCPDYVTEKLFNVLQYNVIPVVLGLADYNSIAPPKSVINVKDFSSIELLVNYLNKVAENDTLYLEYLQWKKDFVVENSVPSMLCELCEKLNQPSNYSSYKNISKWFYKNCTNKYI